ncbi:MAG: putative quinol monooxygenase [Proteobacteria bacterium]|nr:putative quinol monooxygenase [Pseudomonadota bacterium]
MIIVHGTLPILPECMDRALVMAKRMAAATQLEPGCISYDFYIGLSDPNTLLLFQEWESMEALTAHFQTAHMEEFLTGLPDVLGGDVLTRRYAVQSVDEETEEREDTPPVFH